MNLWHHWNILNILIITNYLAVDSLYHHLCLKEQGKLLVWYLRAVSIKKNKRVSIRALCYKLVDINIETLFAILVRQNSMPNPFIALKRNKFPNIL